MSDIIDTTAASAEEPRKDRRRPVVAFVLATLAVGGIGAAATSAAWTDNVFFSADAQAATFDLRGSVAGGDWQQSDDPDSIELVIPAEQLANLLPGTTRTVDLGIQNLGSVDAALTSTVEFVDSTFAADPTASLDGLISSLGAGASDDFTLTVTTPADWSAANRGGAGTIIITISGEATTA